MLETSPEQRLTQAQIADIATQPTLLALEPIGRLTEDNLRSMATVPRIEHQWTCITTNKGVVLASIVSSYFQDAGVYLAVFEFPAVDAPYSSANSFGQDGYITRVVGTRAAIRINNALARIQPSRLRKNAQF